MSVLDLGLGFFALGFIIFLILIVVGFFVKVGIILNHRRKENLKQQKYSSVKEDQS